MAPTDSPRWFQFSFRPPTIAACTEHRSDADLHTERKVRANADGIIASAATTPPHRNADDRRLYIRSAWPQRLQQQGWWGGWDRRRLCRLDGHVNPLRSIADRTFYRMRRGLSTVKVVARVVFAICRKYVLTTYYWIWRRELRDNLTRTRHRLTSISCISHFSRTRYNNTASFRYSCSC